MPMRHLSRVEAVDGIGYRGQRAHLLWLVGLERWRGRKRYRCTIPSRLLCDVCFKKSQFVGGWSLITACDFAYTPMPRIA